ncbi:MAG: metal-binding protein [Hahellaceae bacterium]|nr:metal-binding protein [Hahellaceae bacterium]MCP5170191.1 metal-binding protein [Hahellaceae bacterium]
MIRHSEISDNDLRKMIEDSTVQLGGHRKLKIYGTLYCASGKRMKRENRVFFENEAEALKHHFRPCGHCMREAYRAWICLNK